MGSTVTGTVLLFCVPMILGQLPLPPLPPPPLPPLPPPLPPLPGLGIFTPPEYSTDLETQLRETLFSRYSPDQRPQKMVLVRVSLNLMSINDLDIKDQSMSTSLYLALDWVDTRLRWNNNPNYTNIPFLFSSERQMWRPAVIIENSIDDIDVISRPNVPLRMIESGRVIWTPGGVFVTHCESDVTYYPLDTQTCHIVVSTWAYTAGEVSLAFGREPIGLGLFKEHGEWDLIDTKVVHETAERESRSFTRLKFSLKIRRRPLFHMLNTLFPVILMAFLTVVVFKLPPESGERVGLSLTILLAFAVYLTLISESIPQTSLSASLLSSYLASILLLQSFSVILTVVVLDIYFTPEETPVTDWLRKLTRFLSTVINCSCCSSRHSPVVIPEPDMDYPNVSRGTRFGKRNGKQGTATDPFPLNIMLEDSKKNKQHKPYDSAKQTDQLSPPSASDGGWVSPTISNEVHECTWKQVAAVLDKTFLYLYLLAVCAITSACMGIMWSHFVSDYN